MMAPSLVILLQQPLTPTPSLQVIGVYSLASLGWLSAQALPLIVWPSFVASLLATDMQLARMFLLYGTVSLVLHMLTPRPPAATLYFARALGLAQLGLALHGLMLSGLLPLGDSSSTASPYAWAAVLMSMLYHGAAAFYSYGCYYYKAQPAETAFAVGCTGSSILAAFGLWCLLFGEGSHISRRTGADKRTSGFPFKNNAADKRKVR